MYYYVLSSVATLTPYNLILFHFDKTSVLIIMYLVMKSSELGQFFAKHCLFKPVTGYFRDKEILLNHVQCPYIHSSISSYTQFYSL